MTVSHDEAAFQSIIRDKIDPSQPGFHWKSHGREAIIYFVEGRGIVLIYCEMPAVAHLDVLVFSESKHIESRYYLDGRKVESLPSEERLRIQGLLVKWLSQQGVRHDIKIGQ